MGSIISQVDFEMIKREKKYYFKINILTIMLKYGI